MKESGYCVYMHINKINNKVYIGITSQKPEQRWRNGTNYYGNQHFNRAIQKYGWNEGFEHKVIATNLSKKEAEDIEIELIKKYDSTNRDFGYNIENGGNASGKHSEETKRKISESQKGEKNHMFGKTGSKHHSSKKVIRLNDEKIFDSAYEANRNIDSKTSVAECCNKRKRYAGVDEIGQEMLWMWYEDYLKLSSCEIEQEINRLKDDVKIKKTTDTTYSNNNNAKKIICITTEEVFGCIKEACEKYKISPSSLSQCLSGVLNCCKSKSLGINLVFMFFEEYKIVSQDIINEKIKRSEKRIGRSKKVLFIEENKIFDSTREMCIYLRETLNDIFTEVYIRKVCKGIMPSYKGFTFKYI